MYTTYYVIFTLTVREPAHNNGCAPFPKKMLATHYYIYLSGQPRCLAALTARPI